MENTPNIRTQTLIWHNMESQIHWTDETGYAWFSKLYIAKMNSYSPPELGYFVSDKDIGNVEFRTTSGVTYFLCNLEEFAEL